MPTPITSDFCLSWEEHGTLSLPHEEQYWKHPSPSSDEGRRILLLPFPSFPPPSCAPPTPSPARRRPPNSLPPLRPSSLLSIRPSPLPTRLPSPTWRPTPARSQTVASPTAIHEPSDEDSYLLPLSVPRMPQKAAELLGLVPLPSHERTDSGTSSLGSCWSSCIPRPSISSIPSSVPTRGDSFDMRRASSLPEIRAAFLPPRTLSKLSFEVETRVSRSPLAESFPQSRKGLSKLFGRRGRSASQPTQVESLAESEEKSLRWDAPSSWVVEEGVKEEVEVLQKERRTTRDAWEMESEKLRLRIRESLGH